MRSTDISFAAASGCRCHHSAIRIIGGVTAHPRLCLNSSRKQCFIHWTFLCFGKFVIMSSSKQTLCRHDFHRFDGNPHKVFLSTQFTSLCFMMSCKTAPDVSSASPAMCTTAHEWSRRKHHQPARMWLRMDVTHQLHLLEGLFHVSNT